MIGTVTLRYIAFAFVILTIFSVWAVATTVSVQTVDKQQEVGIVQVLYFEDSSLASTTNPSVNTETSQPSGTGDSVITRGSAASLWSPSFPSGKSLPRGNIALDFWALAKKSTNLVVFVNITSSSGSLVYSFGKISLTISTSETQYELNFPTSAVEIVPAGGYISVTFSLPTGHSQATSATVYWGVNQLTNFQIYEYEAVSL